MGGFAGGDEAGYWDDDLPVESSSSLPVKRPKCSIVFQDGIYRTKAYAKIELPESHHRICSDELYDVIEFIPCFCDTFTIEGCAVPLASNPIYLAYLALQEATNDPEIVDFFTQYKVVVTKHIPAEIQFGGYPSDAAAFLLMAKEACNLILTTDELARIGVTITPDVPFFIYNYPNSMI